MPQPTESPRHQYFIDNEVQAAVLIRVAVYGLSLTAYFAITLICTQWMDEPDHGLLESLVKSFEDVAYWLPGFLLLVPVAAHDLLKMTNQFAGPITRLRREMNLLVQGRSDRPLNFREDDYWVDLTSSYNQIRGELLLLRKRLEELGDCHEELPANLMTDDKSSPDQFEEDTVRVPELATASVLPAAMTPVSMAPTAAAFAESSAG